MNTGGRREVIGMATGPSEAETFWTDFLRSLLRRGLRGVKLVISDAHAGIQAAVSKVMNATWQRCRVHFMRNALAHAKAGQHNMVAAMLRTISGQDSARDIREQWDKVTDSLRVRHPKPGQLMDGAKEDVLAFTGFPKEHWTKIYSTNPLERADGEIKRRTNVVGIFPNDQSIIRLVGAILLEQNDEWAVQNRYMTLATLNPIGDTDRVSLPALPD